MAEVSVSGFAFSTLSKVATVAIGYATGDIKLAWNVKSEHENLTDSMKAICAVVKDVERKQLTPDSLKLWLQNLKDVVYDIDDVLDDVGTRTLQQKVEKGSFVFDLSLNREEKIRKIRERLNAIAALRSKFTLTEEPIDTPIDESVRREAYPIVDERKIIGRDKS